MCVYSMFVYVGARFCLLLANSIICIIAYLQYVPHYKSVSDKYKCHTLSTHVSGMWLITWPGIAAGAWQLIELTWMRNSALLS